MICLMKLKNVLKEVEKSANGSGELLIANLGSKETFLLKSFNVFSGFLFFRTTYNCMWKNKKLKAERIKQDVLKRFIFKQR